MGYLGGRIAYKDFHVLRNYQFVSLCRSMGLFLGLREEEMATLDLFARYHDVGKVELSDDILFKCEPLTEEEWERLKLHPAVGSQIAQSIQELRHISHLILTHHEYWDGSGYLQGLSGEDIPFFSRILSVVDAYDAMRSNRPYARKLYHRDALDRIERAAGTQFDPDLARKFVSRAFWRIHQERIGENVS